jgi:hypothetical protein
MDRLIGSVTKAYTVAPTALANCDASHGGGPHDKVQLNARS